MEPSVHTYKSHISAYAKGEQWQKAEAAFKQMQVAGVTPTSPRTNCLISAYATGYILGEHELGMQNVVVRQHGQPRLMHGGRQRPR